MGAWLRKYGEAIYATRAWEVYGEGPTKMGAAHGVMGPPKEGAVGDIRYTRSKNNSTLYAILLGWKDGEREIVLRSLSTQRIGGRPPASVALLNGRADDYRPLEFSQDEQGLHVEMPNRPFDELAYVRKLTFKGGIPSYDNFAALDTAAHYRIIPGTATDALILGGDLSLSTERKAPANQWKLQHVGRGVYEILNREAPRTALTYDIATGALTVAPFTGAEGQFWKIRHAPGGQFTVSSLQRDDARLSLTTPLAAGSPARVARSADPALARWKLVPICELAQEPFKPHRIPCVIEAEDYDTGCAGDAYHDSDDINQGGLYRPDSGVDLGECSAGGYTLGWTQAGEWTAYTVNVASATSCRVSFHVTIAQPGARFHLESDGVDLTGTIDVPNTKSFQNWTVVDRVIRLEAGSHVLKVVIDGNFVNLDKMVFATAP